jgi:hypothetical protein
MKLSFFIILLQSDGETGVHARHPGAFRTGGDARLSIDIF